MELKLRGEKALVCAASRGLGKAIATVLRNEGASVAICARSKDDLLKTAGQIGAIPIQADVSKEKERVKLIREACEKLGTINILVTNAGGPPVGKFESLDINNWREAVELNFLSSIHLSKLVVPHMKKNGGGRIIHMVSYAAFEYVEGLILSSSIRPSVISSTRTIARELAPYGIGVVAVCPGLFYTSRVKNIIKKRAKMEKKTEQEILSQWTEQIPMGRMGEPVEVGNLVAFLSSPLANYITGCAIVIDGAIMKRII